MGLPVGALQNHWAGYDVYVLASGASAGYIDPAFFRGRPVIGVNNVWRRFSALDYIVRKESSGAETARDAVHSMGGFLVMSKFNCGSPSLGMNTAGDYFFDHGENHLETIDLSPVGNEQGSRLVVSFSTITSAIHLAAYMGAAAIFLIGHDCGTLDGLMNFPGYGDSFMGDSSYRKWLRVIEPQTIALRAKILSVYGIPIYSINPFLNFGLEGHSYER